MEGNVMNAGAEVAYELLCGPKGFPADKGSNPGGEDHSEVGRGEAGYAGDGIETFHINGELLGSIINLFILCPPKGTDYANHFQNNVFCISYILPGAGRN